MTAETGSESGELWRRLEAVLRVAAPGARNGRLRPPASIAQIEAAERAMGLPFPPDLRQAYLSFDGTDLQYDGMRLILPRVPCLILGGCDWLALDQVVQRWRDQREVMSFLAPQIGAPLEALPDAAVRDPMWLDPKWIPIGDAHDGAFAAIDLNPGPKGTCGQLIIASAGGAVCTERVLATSISAYVSQLVSALERGDLVASDNHWVDRAGQRVWSPEDPGASWLSR